MRQKHWLPYVLLRVQHSIFGYSVLDQLQERTLSKWSNYAHTMKPVLKAAWIQRNRALAEKFFSLGDL